MTHIRMLIVAALIATLTGCNGSVYMPGSSDGVGGSSSASSTAGGAGGSGGMCADGQKMCGGGCVANDVPFVESRGQFWRDCDGDTSNGCEVNTFADLNNCGGCGTVCNIDHAQQACVAPGYCEFVACLPGYVDCDGLQVSGCEVHPADDANNCGACGIVCNVAHATPACSGGVCLVGVCDEAWSDCDGIAANGCEFLGACP